MRHLLAVVILIAIVTAAVGLLLGPENILPTLASEEGAYVDQLFSIYAFVIAFFFALIIVIMLYSAVVFRRKKGDDEPGANVHGNSVLEIVWSVIPLGIVLLLAGLGAVYLGDTLEAEADEMVVEVTAAQWSWRFDYPEFGVSSSELYLPNGRQVLFEFNSLDVIHSFWVPEFRLKQDIVPGITTTLRLKPTLSGSYTVRCAELCGLNHANMLTPVTVMEPAEFDAWIAAQIDSRALSPADRGKQLAELNGCVACHSSDGSPSVGPSWLALFGSEEILEDGTEVLVDEDYLLKSILDPNAQIVDGFLPNLMPKIYGDTFSQTEIDALIAYIRSLGN
ncbi:MAG: cytochrome c oxidase subunit II [Anaerolineae bacterium]|nr:MAG: cytochrome c oxidase subunit II [Anaerolineae bacterium]